MLTNETVCRSMKSISGRWSLLTQTHKSSLGIVRALLFFRFFKFWCKLFFVELFACPQGHANFSWHDNEYKVGKKIIVENVMQSMKFAFAKLGLFAQVKPLFTRLCRKNVLWWWLFRQASCTFLHSGGGANLCNNESCNRHSDPLSWGEASIFASVVAGNVRTQQEFVG